MHHKNRDGLISDPSLTLLCFCNQQNVYVYQSYFGLREEMGSKRKPKSNLKSQTKKSKIQNSHKFMMETIFDRFPQLSDNIFESLDEKSLANCTAVDRKWKSTILNQKVNSKASRYTASSCTDLAGARFWIGFKKTWDERIYEVKTLSSTVF